jgi:hypothetical protein
MSGYTLSELQAIFSAAGVASDYSQKRLADIILRAYADIGVIRVVETTGGAGAPKYNYNTRKYFASMSRPLIELATACYGQNYTSAQITALAQTEPYGPFSYSFATYAPSIIQAIYACGESGAESLLEGDFATHTYWAETGQCVDTGGFLAYTHGGTNAGTETQTAGDRLAQGATTLVNSAWYVFDFDIIAAPATPGNLSKYQITTAVASVATDIAPLTATGMGLAGRHSLIFKTAATANVGSFVLDIASTGAATTTIDNLSLKQITNSAYSTNPLSNFTADQALYYGSSGSNYCKKFIVAVVTTTLQKIAEGEYSVYGTLNKQAEPVLDTFTT